MKTIPELIEEIVQVRAQRLPKIQAQLAHLEKVNEKLDEIDDLMAVIESEQNAQQGAYYSLLADNPDIERTLANLSTEKLRKSIKEQMKKLDILHKRFGRNTIRIAMIGYERQGKSTFLQALSGLKSDKVIPAYDGTSCTGALSVIHNIDGNFRVEIEPYSLEDFLQNVKAKLKEIFPDETFYINDINDLASLTFPDTRNLTQKQNGELATFKEVYCAHVNEYSSLLGREKFSLTNEDDVVKHVAQYDRSETPKEGYERKEIKGKTVYQKNYYLYVAIKHVDIFIRFADIDSNRIELVDTVGINAPANAEKIKKEMFRVLREDCDAAVNLFKPDSTGGSYNDDQQHLMEDIREELIGRFPAKWIVYVINKIASGDNSNAHLVGDILKAYERSVEGLDENQKTVAWAKIIDGKDSKDVKQNLIQPLLDLIVKNLSYLDDNLMEDAKLQGEELFAQFFKLRENMEHVISGAAMKNSSEGKLFDDNMADLLTNKEYGLYHVVGVLDEEKYRPDRKKPNPAVNEKLNEIIEGLYEALPDKSDIEDELLQYRETPRVIFEKACHKLRSNIFEQFEAVTDEVITPLREAVKLEMATCLFEAGRMGRVHLANYTIDDGPSMEWLDCLLQEKVTRDRYPELYSVIDYIRTYQFNIKDAVEYEVAKSISMIDPRDSKDENTDVDEEDGIKFVPYSGNEGGSVEERKNAIYQELFNRIVFLQQELRKNISDFAKIPNQSFAARVQKFHLWVAEDKEVAKDLREFYRDNRYVIWKEDFDNIEYKNRAFGNWNQLCTDVNELCVKASFVVS